MLRVFIVAVLCLLFANTASCKRLVCYYNREAATRQEVFTPSQIDPSLCTHIMFGFAFVNNQNEIEEADPGDIVLYSELRTLRDDNPPLKMLLAVGGPGFDTQRFSSMAASPNTRGSFITSVVTFLTAYGFDGLNLDWRYPGDANSQPQDRPRFTDLCQELRTAFDNESPPLILTASVSAEQTMIVDSYEAADVAAELDFLNVLTFDFHDTTATATAHHSPLGALSSNPTDTLTTEYGMGYWKNTVGVPADKLNMGIAAYGVAFTLTNPTTDNGVGAAVSGPGEQGCFTLVPGFWSYYETCLYIRGVTPTWISDQSVPYAVTEGQWVGFDNYMSIDAKVAHINTEMYGGAVVWSLDLDDFTVSSWFCQDGRFPFIRYLSGQLLI